MVTEAADRFRLRSTLQQFSSRLERAEMLLEEGAKAAAILPQILNELSKMRVELVSAATKSDHVPISALLSVSKIYSGVLKSLCLVMVALVVWLTGAKALLSNMDLEVVKPIKAEFEDTQ